MNSAKNAMLATSMIALAAQAVLVEALQPIEHDRITHYPGTDSAFFELPDGAVESLEKLGAVKRVDVAGAAAALHSVSTQSASTQVVTFADAVDMAAVDGQALIGAQEVLEQLDAAMSKSEALATDLAESQKRVAVLEAALDKHAELGTELTASQERVLELEALLAANAEQAATSGAALAADAAVDTGSAAAAEAAPATKTAAKSTKAARG